MCAEGAGISVVTRLVYLLRYFCSLAPEIPQKLFESRNAFLKKAAPAPSLFTSFFAEGAGFEPAKGVNPYLVSSEALSTTQPTLLYMWWP